MTETLEKILNNEFEYTIVQVSAAWCKPCLTVTPLVKEYIDGLPKNYNYLKLDYDVISNEFEKYFEVKKLPYFIIYKKNQKIEEFSSGTFQVIKDKFDSIFIDFTIKDDF
jgi:thiol-disulfide isomerase/thioredoxin